MGVIEGEAVILLGQYHRKVGWAKRIYIYRPTDHKPFGCPCLGVTHSFVSSDAMKNHLSPLFSSLEFMYIPLYVLYMHYGKSCPDPYRSENIAWVGVLPCSRYEQLMTSLQ